MLKEIHLGILVAAPAEWNEVHKYISPVSTESTPYGEEYLYQIQGKNRSIIMHIINSGVGVVDSGACTGYLLEKYNLNSIWVLGTSGGLEESQVLKLYSPQYSILNDRPYFSVKNLNIVSPVRHKSLDRAIIVTVGYPLSSFEGAKEVRKLADVVDETLPVIVDMESASVVKICEKYAKSCFIIKGVTDSPHDEVDTTTKDGEFSSQYYQYIENTKIVMERIFKLFFEIIKGLY
jgi:nucleoside phosphorylase